MALAIALAIGLFLHFLVFQLIQVEGPSMQPTLHTGQRMFCTPATYLLRKPVRGEIVITAYPTVKNAVECTKLQSITYLQKPFTADRLRAVLKEVTPPDPLPASSDAYKCAADLLDAERWEEAISRLKAALAADPTDPAVYFGLERAYLGLGDRETAEKFHNAGRSFT